MAMPSPIVFVDLAGPDSGALARFYASLFGWAEEGGELRLPVVAPLPAAFREDPAEKRIYVGVEDVADTLDRVESEGGSVDQPRFEVPGVAILGLFRDPAGNPMGLVELANGRPKVP